MYLINIKLAGFKSFVDPTTIPVQNHINAIVGPNGCGKSNVVDAIRWVIGESSARELRGQQMADVIFNGTTERKPVGKAFVELLFDNSDRRIVGEYAQFDQVSVRREISREGQSNYYINGTHCRRRDVIDIFLGTGLGPNSYAIIGQGMISQLIEAKPDELRVYLEEAAGISKYRERRRETENRMRHTQENLARLNDIREELDKQMRHLKRQANAAERYQELKKEERQLQLQVKALHWKVLSQELVQQNERMNEKKNAYEQYLSEQRELETTIEKAREQQIELTEKQHDSQKRYYSLAAEIARIEQQIKHAQEQIQNWQTDLKRIEESERELSENTADQQDQIQNLTQEVDTLRPQAADIKNIVQASANLLAQAETAMQQSQSEWDQYQERAAAVAKQLEVLKTKVYHFDQQISQLQDRRQNLQSQLNEGQVGELQRELEESRNKNEAANTAHLQAKEQLAQLNNEIHELQHGKQEQQQLVDQVRHQLQKLEARHTSLSEIQEAALGIKDNEKDEKLAQFSWHQQSRLGQMIQVQTGWELAVETVLNNYLHAICVDTLDEVLPALETLRAYPIAIVDKNHSSGSTQHTKGRTLASQLASEWSLGNWLAGIYIADDLQEALALRSNLSADESVITRDGIWLSQHWVRISKVSASGDSILLRERELKDLKHQISEQQNYYQEEAQRFEVLKNDLLTLEQRRTQQQELLQELQQEMNQKQMQLYSKQTSLDALLKQIENLNREISECQSRIQTAEEARHQVQNEHDETAIEHERLVEQKNHLLAQRDICRTELENAQNKAYRDRQHAETIEIRLTANENQLALLQQTVRQAEQQLKELAERKDYLNEQLSQADAPLKTLSEELQVLLDRRVTLEQEMHQAQNDLEEHNQQLKSLESKRHAAQQAAQDALNELQTLMMECQAIEVRQTTIQEQMTEAGAELNQIFAELPEGAEIHQWNQSIDQVSQRIQRLGPINLAAIEEYQTVNERKEYLDKQNADLLEALGILEDAIRKIDQESRLKFRETYDRVNEQFQQIFPKIFGGGRATLELSDDDILATGITVKAQPPGKRNATIHMLSGGEKALTAISLVFSMFQLNPAPFCVLDEVDAPLDDLNVGRFSQLVKEMSKNIQFLVISHNKITIETADHLMGITMQEAGVSRLVAVDIKQAIEMATA